MGSAVGQPVVMLKWYVTRVALVGSPQLHECVKDGFAIARDPPWGVPCG